MTDAEHALTRYTTFDVPVDGGDLRVGRWDPETTARDGAPVVVAIHGITAHHLSWPFVARDLDCGEVATLVAPDLRGRGRSRDLPPDVGLAAHADDVAALIRHLDLADGTPVIVLGHSMGGFVGLVLAHRHPDLVDALVLIDGGLPFPPADQESTAAGLELIKQRLQTSFPSAEAYVEVFRAHPAFAHDWSEVAEEYARYDALEEESGYRSSAVLDAVVVDQGDVMGGADHAAAASALGAGEIDVPTVFMRAPRGFVDDPPGLYAPDTVAGFAATYPSVDVQEVDRVNHYTIVMGETGARVVADTVRDLAARLRLAR